MKQDRECHQPARRNFLKMASVGAAAGTAGAVIGAKSADAVTVSDQSSGGYQETRHIRKVYETARF